MKKNKIVKIFFIFFIIFAIFLIYLKFFKTENKIIKKEQIIVEKEVYSSNIIENVNYSTKDCYFKKPGEPVIRAYDEVEAGDEFYWNGATANFELDSTDDIDFIYQTSSSNT